jgi:HEPN domain-containing protein
MIPEAEGATPIGIFLLADEYLEAARSNNRLTRKFSGGPTRLLCYHACELFLKAFLREQGEDIATLRGYSHDLSKMLESARSKGLLPSMRAEAAISRVVAKNDYVRVRYMVVETEDDLSAAEVLKLAERVRRAVRHALKLDELGMPLGQK